MTRIGNWEVVYSCSLILPLGEATASVDFSLGAIPLAPRISARVRIENDPPAVVPAPPSLTIQAENGVPLILLRNWRSPTGSATTEPLSILRFNNGRTIYVMVCHWLVGAVNRLDLQFLSGGG